MNKKKVDGALCAINLCLYLSQSGLKFRKRRAGKVRKVNRNRETYGFYVQFKKIKEFDSEAFFKYTRMTVPIFNMLVHLVDTHLARKRKLPDSIGTEQRVAVTLQ